MIPWEDVNDLAVMDGYENDWACSGVVLRLRVGIEKTFILQLTCERRDAHTSLKERKRYLI
jgi:hypothetical protein